jgi:hypothetical protein
VEDMAAELAHIRGSVPGAKVLAAFDALRWT